MTQSVIQTTQMLRNHTNFSYGSLNKTKHSYQDEQCKLRSQVQKNNLRIGMIPSLLLTQVCEYVSIISMIHFLQTLKVLRDELTILYPK